MFMLTPEMIGQLICDEIKLKGDIYFSEPSNAVKGFTEDFASARKIIQDLLDAYHRSLKKNSSSLKHLKRCTANWTTLANIIFRNTTTVTCLC